MQIGIGVSTTTPIVRPFPSPVVESVAFTESNVNATEIVAGYPADVVDGDLVVLAVVRDGTGSSFDAIIGWTPRTGTISSGTGCAMRVYTKVASSEPATVTQTWAIVSERAYAVMARVSGFSDILNVGSTIGDTDSPQNPSVSGSPALALLFVGVDSNIVATADAGYPADTVGLGFKQPQHSAGVGIGLARKEIHGPIGVHEWTDSLSVSGEWAGVTLTIAA